MVRDVSEILKQCGWNDGFRIPVSNAQNKKLEDAVEEAMKKKAQLLADMEETSQRLETIKKHLISGDKQRKNCQELLHETRKELDNAQHLDKMCRTERDSVQKGTKIVEKELLCLSEICEKLKADICRREAQIGKLRKLMRCDSAELLVWNDSHQQGEDDLQMLQADFNQDETIFKELDTKREKLEMDVEQKRKMADNATTEVTVLEEVLDRTAQLYRQMHDEKCALLKQWEASVRALHRKDQDINKLLTEIDTLKGQGRIRMAELVEAKELFENLKSNNAEAEAKVAETQKLISALRENDIQLQKDIQELQSELDSVRRMVTVTNKRIEATRAENKRLAEEKCEKEERIKQLREATNELCKRYEEASKGATSAEQRASHLEQLIKAEQHQSNTFNIDISRLQGTLYRMQSEFTEIDNQTKLRQIEIQALKKNATSIERATTQMDENLFKAKERIYNLEVEEELLTSRISALSGEGDVTVEQQQIKTKLLQLEETLMEKKSELNLLTSQADRLELDGRQLSNLISATNVELTRIKTERNTLQLLVDGGKKALKAARSSLNDSLIELAVFKVRARQVFKAERQECGKAISLRRQRFEWEKETKERMIELNTERDRQFAKRKVLSEDRAMIMAELNNLNTRIKQYAIRYAIVNDSIGKDEFGEFISPTQLKLKAAQERILLVEEGDILDAKINKAEKEIEAMENTLKVVNVSNENYRNRLAIIDPDGPEAQELKKVEQQYLETLLSLKKCREEESQAEKRITDLQRELRLLEKQTSEALKIQECRANAADDLSHNLQEQDVKLHRAESQLIRFIRELRSRSSSTMFIMEEKDIMIRDISAQNKNALDQLAVLANKFLDMGPIITRLLQERDLSLPPVRLGRSQSDSSRSSVSSSGSVCSSDHSSESLCTMATRKLFEPSKLGPYRGTTQTSSQLQFPMKKTVLCCAPHSPITLSSETLTIPSITLLHPPASEGETSRASLSRIHPIKATSSGLLPGKSDVALSVSSGGRRSVSRSVSESGSQISGTGSLASSFKSEGLRSIRSKESENLLGSLRVESLSLTGKPQVSKSSTKIAKSTSKELKQRSDAAMSMGKAATAEESVAVDETQREDSVYEKDQTAEEVVTPEGTQQPTGARVTKETLSAEEVQTTRGLQLTPETQITEEQSSEGAEEQSPEGAEEQSPEGAEEQSPEGAEEQSPEGAEEQSPEGAEEQAAEEQPAEETQREEEA